MPLFDVSLYESSNVAFNPNGPELVSICLICLKNVSDVVFTKAVNPGLDW